MRASPPYLCRVARFGVWRCVVAFVTLADVGVMLAWVATRDERLSPIGIAAWCCAAALIAALAASVAQARPLVLRWDGRQWWRIPPGRPFDPAAAIGCEIDIALDLGDWLMLRLRSTFAAEPRRAIWLPVQRRGFDASWHGLRCALYASPAAGSSPADAAEFAR